MKRVDLLDEAVRAAASDSLGDDLRLRARSDAHKLHGTLGSFGFPRASELAGELEKALANPVSPSSALTLTRTLEELRQTLAEPGAEESGGEEREARAERAMRQGNETVAGRSSLVEDTGPTLSVLAMDDDAIALAVLRRMLTVPGIELRAVRREPEFWDALTARQPDVVVLDLEMPDHTGREICEMLRARPDTHDLPVLIVSATDDPAIRQSLFAAGANHCLAKPLQKEQLLAAVRSHAHPPA